MNELKLFAVRFVVEKTINFLDARVACLLPLDCLLLLMLIWATSAREKEMQWPPMRPSTGAVCSLLCGDQAEAMLLLTALTADTEGFKPLFLWRLSQSSRFQHFKFSFCCCPFFNICLSE